MASAKVRVHVFRSDGHEGYFAAGRKWPQGITEAVIEDEPDFSLAQKLAQLDAAKGGQVVAHEFVGGSEPRRAPALLDYEVIAPEPTAREVPAEPAAPTQHEEDA